MILARLALLLILVFPSLAFGQPAQGIGTQSIDKDTKTVVATGDAANSAQRVNCVAGCAGSPGSADGTILDGVDPAIKATVKDLTNSNPVLVGIVDGSGDQITSFGGGTQYNQGTATTDTDTLTMAGCVRADAAAVATGVADGDRARCIVDSTGRLWVNVGTVAVTGPLTDAQLRATPVPVSGTVTVTDGSGALNVIVDSGSLTANAGTNLNTSALALEATLGGVLTSTNFAAAFGTAGTADTQVMSVQGIAGMTKILVTPDSVALPANQSVNVAQINGVTPLMGTGNTGTGSPRVTLATDQANLTTPLNVNAAQINGVTPLMGNGATGTGSHRTTVADNNSAVATWGHGATGAAPPANAVQMGGRTSGATGGVLTGIPVCDSFANVNVVTATTTLLVTGVSGRHVRICGMSLLTAGANNVALISGTGATCGTGTTGMTGGTTSATGYNFAANQGLTQGNGLGTINQTNATGDSVCVITSAATQLSGRIAYTIY